MRAPRPSAVTRIIGHWRAAPAFSSNTKVKTMNKRRCPTHRHKNLKSQILGIQPQLPRFIEANLRADGSRCDKCINIAVHTKIAGRTWLSVACAPMSHAGGWKATTQFIAPAMQRAEGKRHTRESWYASWLQCKPQRTVTTCNMLDTRGGVAPLSGGVGVG